MLKEYYTYEKNYAMIEYKHQEESDCSGGLAIAVPLGKKAEEWGRFF